MKAINKITFLRHAFVLSLLLGSASAQDLSAQVSQDPKAGTVTYTFDLNGPPQGVAILFASFVTLQTPIQLPGIGILDLDLMSLTQIGVVPMSLFGRSRFKLTLP